MREAIRRAMREYFNGRTYLGAGQYAVTERASQAGEALEAYAKSHPELLEALAREWHSLYEGVPESRPGTQGCLDALLPLTRNP